MSNVYDAATHFDKRVTPELYKETVRQAKETAYKEGFEAAAEQVEGGEALDYSNPFTTEGLVTGL